jgi:hypothetical protein
MCVSHGWTFHVQFGGATHVYQSYFRFTNLLNVLSSLVDGGGPGRSKSTYKIVLSLIRYFSGRRCGDNPFIFSRNDKDLKDLPITFISSFLLVVLSSFKSSSSFTSASFSYTFARLFLFFSYCSCFSYIFHLQTCMDCKNGVSS